MTPVKKSHFITSLKGKGLFESLIASFISFKVGYFIVEKKSFSISQTVFFSILIANDSIFRLLFCLIYPSLERGRLGSVTNRFDFCEIDYRRYRTRRTKSVGRFTFWCLNSFES